jgi:hypothetical protein
LKLILKVTAYQWDFAYGTKPNRINKMADEIMADNSYWFHPIEPTSEQVEELKNKMKGEVKL